MRRGCKHVWQPGKHQCDQLERFQAILNNGTALLIKAAELLSYASVTLLLSMPWHLASQHSLSTRLVLRKLSRLSVMSDMPAQVHAYVAGSGGKTAYLSELVSGSEVTVVDQSGCTRQALVGRCKIEKRPMVILSSPTLPFRWSLMPSMPTTSTAPI